MSQRKRLSIQAPPPGPLSGVLTDIKRAIDSLSADYVGASDLVRAGLLRRLSGGGLGIGDGVGAGGGSAGQEPIGTPPAPIDVVVTPGYSFIMIEFGGASYPGHGHAQILRAMSNDYSAAVVVGQTTYGPYADTVGAGSPTYYYWVRFVNIAEPPVVGPPNAQQGTPASTAPDVEAILGLLAGQIASSELDQSLLAPIEQVPILASNLAQESISRSNQTGELFAKYTVKVDVAGHVSGFGLASTANNAAPFSQFGIRADQFYVAPPAISSATAPTTNLYKGMVWADTSVTPNVTRYYTGSAWSTTPQALPFVIQTTPTTINGEVVQPGIYADNAFFARLVATRGQIGLLAVDDARIASMSVSKLKAGSVSVGEYAQSTGYVAGSAGWRINGDGTAEFSGVVVRGTVYATAGQIGGITIASNAVRAGQTAYNTGSGFHLGSDGRLSLGNSEGNSLTWDGASLSVKGTINGSTINGSTMNSGALNLQGDGGSGWGYARSLNKWWGDGGNGWIFARQGSDGGTFAEMKGGNQRIWMSSWGDCGIQFPGITMTNGGLTINQANVINTLNLAGQAVTIPVGAYSSGLTPSGSYAQTATIVSTGAPIVISASVVIANNQENISWNLLRNGVVIYQGPSIFNPNPLAVAFTVIDTPGAGSHTYQLAASNNSYNRALVLLEVKK